MKIYSDFGTVGELKNVPILVTEEIKLKRPNKPAYRFKLKDLFGFIPDEIIVQLSAGRNNTFNLIVPDPKGKSKSGKALLQALEEEKEKSK